MSLLESLGATRKRVIAKQKQTLRLPRWESEGVKVYVTWVLADKETVKKIGKLGDLKRDKDEALYNFYLQFHVDHIIDITFDNGYETASFEKCGDEGLSEALEIENPSARNNVAALFISELDVLAFGDAIIEWSGTTREQIEEAAAGE